MNDLDDDVTLRAAANVFSRRLDEELVLLDFANGEYFALDPIGAVIWEAIATNGTSIREVAATLVARYNVQYSDVLRDVRALVRELLDRSLVVTE